MGATVFPPAASGPTLSEITTAGTSAGWGATGGAWTLLDRKTAVSPTGITYSGLGSYKKYRIVCGGFYISDSSSYWPMITINGDNSGNKYSGNWQATVAYNTYGNQGWFDTFDQKNMIPIAPMNFGSAYNWGNRFIVEIDNVAGSSKIIRSEAWGYHAGYPAQVHGEILGSYNSTSNISSIKLHVTNAWSTSETLSFNLNGTTSFIELWGTN